MNVLKVKKLTDNAKLPTLGTPFAAGMDVYADLGEDTLESIVLKPHETRAINTGLSFEPPSGYHIKVESRSGTAAKNSIGVLCGVIDEDYRGELKIVLFNNSDTEEFCVINGQKIAQLVLHKTEEVEIVEVSELSDSVRGSSGFGSTGC